MLGKDRGAGKRIGQFLIDRGLITLKQLDDALRVQKKDPRKLGELLVQQQAIEEHQLLHALGEYFGLDVAQAGEVDLTDEALARIPEQVALKHGVVPIAVRNNRDLVVATSGALTRPVRDSLQRMSGLRICPVLMAWRDFSHLLDRAYQLGEAGASSGAMRAVVHVPAEVVAVDGDTDIIALADRLLLRAVEQRASDIHIEPDQPLHRVRMRVDGALRVTDTLPAPVAGQCISRLKVLSDLDIAERRRPQDGALVFDHTDLTTPPISVRVSVLPCAGGEKCVLRLLPPRDQVIPMNELGMDSAIVAGMRKTIAVPHGIVLVTGPTGSGKSTTLYTCLAELRDDRVNITTIEDPVEMRMRAINQVQVDTHNHVSFAGALRSILRQDPDIVMLGEIRDAETASLALRAALTGHLVLSTLHTNDAIGSIPRLLDMGCEPFLLASSLRAVLAQRLVRRVCDRCRHDTAIDPIQARSLGIDPASMPVIGVGAGCSDCGHTGYRGRVGLYEFLPVDDELRALIGAEAGRETLEGHACASGLQDLRAAGIAKIAAGVTTPEEVLKVVVSL
ncbi:MAG: GspE/PulE family protein [Planctomycetota bacterium]